MILHCYTLTDFPHQIQPARPNRFWMDQFTDRAAYRCLPISVANAHGWEILSPINLLIRWNGGGNVTDLTVHSNEKLPGDRPVSHLCNSHFARGVVTFMVNYLFTTPPGWHLYISGPPNDPKRGIYPLTGVVESDWAPYPFTMNWQMLEAGDVQFRRDEPFCFIFPFQSALHNCTPIVEPLTNNPELNGLYEMWRDDRAAFNAGLERGDKATLREAWQRHYFRGINPDGSRGSENHSNRLRVSKPRAP